MLIAVCKEIAFSIYRIQPNQILKAFWFSIPSLVKMNFINRKRSSDILEHIF